MRVSRGSSVWWWPLWIVCDVDIVVCFCLTPYHLPRMEGGVEWRVVDDGKVFRWLAEWLALI